MDKGKAAVLDADVVIVVLDAVAVAALLHTAGE